jgi:hypothetical protein
LPQDWTIYNVPIAGLNVSNTVVAWSQFIGSSNWYFACNQFLPCAPSGSGHLLLPSSQQGVDASSTMEVIQQRMSASVPESGCSCCEVELNYDDYCSTQDQLIWSSCAQSSPTQYVLKVIRYGEKRIGILTRRTAGGSCPCWISDDFDCSSENVLIQEGNFSSMVRVRPA